MLDGTQNKKQPQEADGPGSDSKGQCDDDLVGAGAALSSAAVLVDTTHQSGPAKEADPCVAPTGATAFNEDGPEKKKRNRCTICKKKVGLTGFGCRCGGLFCAIHRYSDKHDCSFDYRLHGAEEIRRNNPVVKGEKCIAVRRVHSTVLEKDKTTTTTTAIIDVKTTM
ncbi:unnamed protein product [Notodromas monacha]|uniref:AN1-type domain-containing protein n=1 Tax=Notodromas monacha TaxID=399045 RepID=A0A7R9BIV4_9CRUS|nr:unnamed protein product [Notodromas monacha]CAG0916343.1 unnamed protein product [Notodromas monacha]